MFERFKRWFYSLSSAKDCQQMAYDALNSGQTELSCFGGEHTPEEMDEAISAIKADMFGSTVSSAFRGESKRIFREWSAQTFPLPPMPEGFQPEKIEGKAFEDNTVLACPGGGANLFYPELKLILLFEGNAVTTLLNRGYADVLVYPLTLCFPYYEAKPTRWLNRVSGNYVQAADIGFCMLYTAAQIKWMLQTKTDYVPVCADAFRDQSEKYSKAVGALTVVQPGGLSFDEANSRYAQEELDVHIRLARILQDVVDSGDEKAAKRCIQLMRFILGSMSENRTLPEEKTERWHDLLASLKASLFADAYIKICENLTYLMEQGYLKNQTLREETVTQLALAPSRFGS